MMQVYPVRNYRVISKKPDVSNGVYPVRNYRVTGKKSNVSNGVYPVRKSRYRYKELGVGVTLLELMIAIVLMGLIILSFTSIDLFSRYHVITSDRRAKVQNEVSHILEHMTKTISKAIGNEDVNGAGSVVDIDTNASRTLVSIYIDASENGQREDPISNPSVSDDHWIAYLYNSTGQYKYQIRYCSRCRNDKCKITSCMDIVEELSYKYKYIAQFIPTLLPDNNFITISITGCWQPDTAVLPNGTPDNPCVNMNTSIKMPSVSTN